MPYYTPLWQGEGISGPDTVGAGTSQLYSCIGIAFVNRSTRRGGLYHYSASSLNNQIVADTIQEMMIDIRPDEIVITPALITAPNIGSTSEDLGAIMNLLHRHSSVNTTITSATPSIAAQLVWTAAGPTFNQPPFQVFGDADYSSDESLDEHEVRAQNAAAGRDLGGSVLYYGADLEHNPNAPGPAQAGPSAPAQAGRTRFKKGTRGKWIRERCTPF